MPRVPVEASFSFEFQDARKLIELNNLRNQRTLQYLPLHPPFLFFFFLLLNNFKHPAILNSFLKNDFFPPS